MYEAILDRSISYSNIQKPQTEMETSPIYFLPLQAGHQELAQEPATESSSSANGKKRPKLTAQEKAKIESMMRPSEACLLLRVGSSSCSRPWHSC